MKFFISSCLLSLSILANDSPQIDNGEDGRLTIAFPDAQRLKSYIDRDGKNFTPPKGNFFAKLGFPPPKDKIGILWYDAMLASFSAKVMTHDEFIIQLSKAHRIVFDAIIKETDQTVSFLANGASAMWCQQFYRMTLPKEYWNYELDFLRLQ